MPGAMEKRHFSYNQIHETIRAAVQDQNMFADFRPTLIVSIGGGGFIPARILRTFLRQPNGKSIPIQAIGLTLYEHDDGCDPLDRPVRKTQWLTYGSHEAAVSLQGHSILIVDEVDDTRKTLAYAVDELVKDIEEEKRQWDAAHAVKRTNTPAQCSRPTACSHSSQETPSPCSDKQQEEVEAWQPPQLGVFVVHNKLKPKKAELPDWLMQNSYFSGGDIPDQWVVYPWDAPDIWEHTLKAEAGRAPLAAVNT